MREAHTYDAVRTPFERRGGATDLAIDARSVYVTRTLLGRGTPEADALALVSADELKDYEFNAHGVEMDQFYEQEFILPSDVLGASMQTITINNEALHNATEATVFGPFFVEGSSNIGLGGDIAAGAPGEPCWVEGTVTDTEGNPVPGALIEVWEADEDSFYDVQCADDRTTGRGHLNADDEGCYYFWGVTPTPYPIPHGGPVDRLLAATGRSPIRASHLHFMVVTDGFRTLVTHIFPRGDELPDRDSVFGVRDSLIVDFESQAAGSPTPDGRTIGEMPWSRVRFDIVLAPTRSRDKA